MFPQNPMTPQTSPRHTPDPSRKPPRHLHGGGGSSGVSLGGAQRPPLTILWRILRENAINELDTVYTAFPVVTAIRRACAVPAWSREIPPKGNVEKNVNSIIHLFFKIALGGENSAPSWHRPGSSDGGNDRKRCVYRVQLDDRIFAKNAPQDGQGRSLSASQADPGGPPTPSMGVSGGVWGACGRGLGAKREPKRSQKVPRWRPKSL